MAGRQGVLARLRSNIKRGKGGKESLAYVTIILNDPCVYCGEFECDSIDHITPVSKRSLLSTGFGKNHWTNFAPCHKSCNINKSDKGIFYDKLGKLSKHL